MKGNYILTLKIYMMKKILIMVLLAQMSWCATAQTYGEEEMTTEEQVIQVTNATPMLFQTLGINNEANPRSATLTGNNLFLQQAGSLNRANIATVTEASDIRVDQNGDRNTVTLAYRTRTAITDIKQLGDDNTIVDFVNRPGTDASIDLQQTGNGLRFERQGTNSITESLKFRQTEAAPTIIIRSFN